MTTKEEHNKYLAYSHLGYAGFQLFMMLVMGVFSYLMLDAFTADARADFPVGLVALILGISMLFQLLFSVPSMVAGLGLLKQKSWARTAGIVAGVMAAMSFPIGTAVCVYTFWFFFSEPGKALYDRPSMETRNRSDYFLNEPSEVYATDNWTERKREYAPPKEMPNWRE
jgi:hypothetical protein